MWLTSAVATGCHRNAERSSETEQTCSTGIHCSHHGCALVAAAVPAAAGAPASAATAPASAATAPAGRWGKAQQVGGLNALNEGGAADVGSVSCGSPGNCVAVGTYRTADHVQHAFRAEEKGGARGAQEQVTNVVTTPAVMD